MKNPFLIGRLYYLRFLERDDINERYLSWMNDKEVTKYLHLPSEEGPYTIEGLVDFLEKHQNENSYFFAIIDKNNDKHIGNVKLAVTDKTIGTAELGMLVGEKDYWGKSCMYDVYSILIDYAFNKLHIKIISLGADINNVAAIITFKKLGFSLKKITKKHYIRNGQYIDSVRFGLSFKDYCAQKG